jgi:hypothetical protein
MSERNPPTNLLSPPVVVVTPWAPDALRARLLKAKRLGLLNRQNRIVLNRMIRHTN